MRTTLRLDDQLLSEAKNLAAETGQTLAALIEDALREMLARRQRHGGRAARLPSFSGNGLNPGVDLDNSAALLELMAAPPDPR